MTLTGEGGIGAQSLHDRIIMATLIGVVALLPLVAVFAHRGAGIMLLLMGLAVASRAALWRQSAAMVLWRPDFSNPVVLGTVSFLAFCLWIYASSLWSPTDGSGTLIFHVLLPGLAAGALVWEILRRPPTQIIRLANIFAGAVFLSVALLFFEAMTGGALRLLTPPDDHSPQRFKDITALARGLSIVVPLLFPASLIMWRRAPAAQRSYCAILILSFFALSLIASWKLGVFANTAGLMAGLAFGAIGVYAPRKTLWALMGLIITIIAVSAFIAAVLPAEKLIQSQGHWLPTSWAQRLFIWREAGQAALDCRPFGCGADAARALHVQGETIIIQSPAIQFAIIPTHPHNVFLQILWELGAPGAIFFTLVIIAGGRSLLSSSPSGPIIACICAAAACFVVSFLVETSLWQVWRTSVIGLTAFGMTLSYSVNQIGV